MEVVGWSPPEESQDSAMFKAPPQVGGWSGAEDRDPSMCAGPSSISFPRPYSPRFESATVYQRRLKDPKHVPRPRNSFIIFRCDFTHKYIANGGSERASDTQKADSLSKRAGEAWKNASSETKRCYQKLADEERALHRANYPGYRFRPRRQKPAGGRRSLKRRAGGTHSKRSAGRSPSVFSPECNQLSQNDPLQIQTITVPTSSSTLSQSHPSRHSTPDFFHGYGSTTPTSPCSPLSPADDILYMPRPAIGAVHSDPLFSYTTVASQFHGYPRDPLAPVLDDFSLFGQAYAEPDPLPSFDYPPLAAVASSLTGWDGSDQWQRENVDSQTPKPVCYQESDLVNNSFTSLTLADGTMDYMGTPFGLDPSSFQSDMDAYRMGLKEYGISPACNQ